MFKADNKIYNLRSSGVLILNDKILIQRGVEDTEYALPGGQLKFGETGAETVIREFKEEMGVNVFVDKFLWIEEAFWKWNNSDCHTICFYYLLKMENPDEILSKGSIFKSEETDESRLIFKWIDLEKIDNYKIYPIFLKDEIYNIKDGIKHFIYKE